MKIKLNFQSYRESLSVHLYPQKYMSFTNLSPMGVVTTLFMIE